MLDVGPIVACSIRRFFDQDETSEVLRKLKAARIDPRSEARAESEAFSGKSIVFTGSLHRLTRDRARALVHRLGGRPSSSVSKNTDLVVAGEKAGSKLDKANLLGIRAISEDDFIKMVEESGVSVE